jgi:hypothetical protein
VPRDDRGRAERWHMCQATGARRQPSDTLGVARSAAETLIVHRARRSRANAPGAGRSAVAAGTTCDDRRVAERSRARFIRGESAIAALRRGDCLVAGFRTVTRPVVTTS